MFEGGWQRGSWGLVRISDYELFLFVFFFLIFVGRKVLADACERS